MFQIVTREDQRSTDATINVNQDALNKSKPYPGLIQEFVDNYLELPYKVALSVYIEKSEKVLITLNWFREDIDLTHLQELTSISEISKEMLNNLNIKGN